MKLTPRVNEAIDEIVIRHGYIAWGSVKYQCFGILIAPSGMRQVSLKSLSNFMTHETWFQDRDVMHLKFDFLRTDRASISLEKVFQ